MEWPPDSCLGPLMQDTCGVWACLPKRFKVHVLVWRRAVEYARRGRVVQAFGPDATCWAAEVGHRQALSRFVYMRFSKRMCPPTVEQ